MQKKSAIIFLDPKCPPPTPPLEGSLKTPPFCWGGGFSKSAVIISSEGYPEASHMHTKCCRKMLDDDFLCQRFVLSMKTKVHSAMIINQSYQSAPRGVDLNRQSMKNVTSSLPLNNMTSVKEQFCMMLTMLFNAFQFCIQYFDAGLLFTMTLLGKK